MSMLGGFLGSGAVYRSYLGDGEDGGSLYEDYRLSSVYFRLSEGFGEDEVLGCEGYLYYFPELSGCTDSSGESAELPDSGLGDRCVIGGRDLRVGAAREYVGMGQLSHRRIELR